MQRIHHATRKHDLFGAGKDGYTEGSPGIEAATVVTADALNQIQEEIANVIEGQGITLNAADRTQLAQAIERFSYRTPVTRSLAINLATGQPGSKVTPLWQYSPLNGLWTADAAAAGTRMAFPLDLPSGAEISAVRAAVTPGAARAATFRMQVFLAVAQFDNTLTGLGPLAPDVTIGDEDDGTTNAQVISCTPSAPIVVDRASGDTVKHYLALVDCGSYNSVSGDGAPGMDTLFGLTVEFTDPGPRSY